MDYREGIQVLREARVHAPAIVHWMGEYHIFERTKWVSSGASIAAALWAGGFLPRPEIRAAVFTAKGTTVVYKGVPVAEAQSNNMAVRIANALNDYVPGERGN